VLKGLTEFDMCWWLIQTAGIEGMAGVDDVEAEEVLAEFDFLVSETGEGAGEAQVQQGDGTEWGKLCPTALAAHPTTTAVQTQSIQIVYTCHSELSTYSRAVGTVTRYARATDSIPK